MIKNKSFLIKSLSIILLSGFFLSACGKKTPKTTPVANPTPQKLELSEEQKPIISLIPRADGHELKLIIDNIPSLISEVEYELIYSAIDQGLEMEKGVGDTIKVTTKKIERDLLLGTSSCTNGCKYKYDQGVIGGTLSLTLLTNDNQSLRYETPFVLKTSSDIKKDAGISLDIEKLQIKGTITTKSDYFVLIKNLPNYYSLFSSGNGKGNITEIIPATVTKDDKTSFVGKYVIN